MKYQLPTDMKLSKKEEKKTGRIFKRIVVGLLWFLLGFFTMKIVLIVYELIT